MKTDLSKIFRYCPGCGARGPRAYSKDKHIKCGRCGFEYFHNVASAAGAIIECESKVLLLVRANEPKKGLLDLPGGFAEYGESIEETLAREVREELGIKVKNLRYLISAPNTYVYKGVKYITTDMFFTCRIDNLKKITPAKNEVAKIKLYEPAKIPLNKLAFGSGKTAIKHYIKLRHQTHK